MTTSWIGAAGRSLVRDTCTSSRSERLSWRFSLTPKDNGFYDLFSESAKHLVEGAAELTAILGATDQDEREAIAARMSEVETSADEATHELIRKVNSSFITPFDREDIHGLASALDDCVDHMDAAADLVALYRIDNFPKGVTKQVEILSRMAELTVEAMPRAALDEGPQHLLDRDQPSRELRRQGLPPHAGRALQRRGRRRHHA